jgi:hypothetical protein
MGNIFRYPGTVSLNIHRMAGTQPAGQIEAHTDRKGKEASCMMGLQGDDWDGMDKITK